MLKLSCLRYNEDNEIEKTTHYCYIAVKKENATRKCELNWPSVLHEIMAEQEDWDDNEEEQFEESMEQEQGGMEKIMQEQLSCKGSILCEIKNGSKLPDQ